MCKKGSVKAVMKVALSESAATSLEWESMVLDRIIARQNLEDRTVHLVRKIGNGSTTLTVGNKQVELAYVIMECLPGNPVPIIGNLLGENQTLKIIEYGLQLLKAIYDMHQIGLIHRDIKPENIGMYDNKIVVMYDMGMARLYLDNNGHHRPPRSHAGMRGTEEWSSLNAETGRDQNKIVVMYDMGMARLYLDSNGHHRPPRSHAGMRGTEEWSSLNAETGRDQGRVDDLWGWLYCLNEWVNCRSQKPQLWSAYEREPNIRQWMKSPLFSTRMLYLRTLGRDDTPDYFYLATLLQESSGRFKRKQKPESINYDKVGAEIALFEREFF
ncbi:hypothetical protein DICVIV_01679 [Dictyocaulus viviparus]|uniref:Protein kinase domain-containing protein n=1 Tax=Dictyocaulus viviparus TaxID=29172 RepID=A0A0D8Y5S8_DICVI|nr:hypothetical protein DICVIV_01679 [Dictyocaulus viviparus]